MGLQLPADPAEAVELLQSTSREQPVWVFKKSPICPVSSTAEGEFRRWLDESNLAPQVAVTWIDVIDERPLARGLTTALDVQHESPQALLFHQGKLVWYDSHQSLNFDQFEEVVRGLSG